MKTSVIEEIRKEQKLVLDWSQVSQSIHSRAENFTS